MFASVRNAVALAGLAAASLGALGCIVEASDSVPPPVVVEPGQLTVRWTVLEGVDPNFCVVGRAAAIDIVVSTTTERFVGEFQAPCTSFATTISTLYPGTYVADALLVDSAGHPRTTNVRISPFTIVDRSELIVDVDFPADSFLESARGNAFESEGDDASRMSPSATTDGMPAAL